MLITITPTPEDMKPYGDSLWLKFKIWFKRLFSKRYVEIPYEVDLTGLDKSSEEG